MWLYGDICIAVTSTCINGVSISCVSSKYSASTISSASVRPVNKLAYKKFEVEIIFWHLQVSFDVHLNVFREILNYFRQKKNEESHIKWKFDCR